MKESSFDWNRATQFTLTQFFLAVFIPSGIAFFGFHVIVPALVGSGMPPILAWPSVASAMLLLVVGFSVFVLHQESKMLEIPLAARMCFKKLSAKEWGFYTALILIALGLTIASQQLNLPFMNALHISVPHYMPFFLNPALDPTSADMSVLSPEMPLHGHYELIMLMAITLTLNILAEELYFRAWILPKLSSYGKASWILNGSFFALYHTFQIWLLPTLLVASLSFAYIFYRSKSIWPSLVAHLVFNLLFSILGIMMLVMK